ncbi:zeatin O-glucosyltransferase-like [Silene latifolia]|uniref:zeatin O-glucosyltransferase-like n=1 Tax=Silene latifolia TaxID=37657 RepID=UPI003D7845EA
MEGSQVAVVMVPFLEQSHLNSLLQLSHILASYNIPVHYASSSTLIRQVTLRNNHHPSNLSSHIHFHSFNLPPISQPDFKPDTTTNFPTHLLPLFQASAHLRLPFSQLLQQLSPQFKRIVVIHDCNMASVVQDVKAIVPNAESYSFFGISAFSLFYMFWDGLPQKPFQLDQSDIDPTRIPGDDGFIPPEVMEFVLQQFSFLGLESGRLYNTSRALEGRFMELLEKLTGNSEMKHFAIGPFNPINLKSSEPEKQRHECLEWLDKQEEHAVIYISFGSTTSVSDEQNAELAQGLERSGVKFVWVIRKADTADVFAEGGVTKAGLLPLPEGWEERMRDRGIVIREWAPQLEILGHRSIGGFMSHCGWNSCIESISMGVPIAAWPMHSEQPKNAFLVSEVLKVGIVVKDLGSLGELVMSSSIENVIKRMMASKEGDELRNRAVEMGEVVRGSVAKGGASSLELDSFVAHITR